MKRRWTTAAVAAVLLTTSALASPPSHETWANDAWRWLGDGPVADQSDVDEGDCEEEDCELTPEELIELFGELAADTGDAGIRWELDVDLSLFVDTYDTSESLAEFFRGATLESIKPFLDSEQLLQQAARYADDPGIIRFLLAQGFDPNKAFGPPKEPIFPYLEPHRAGPLHDAARYNANPAIVDALVKGGADVQAKRGWDLYTPLHYAARHNNAAVVSALIRSGAQPNEVNGYIHPTWSKSPDINGNTPLHVAVCTGKAPVIDVLVAAGADVQQANSSGATPFHFAIWCGNATSTAALLRHGADANAVVTLVNGETEMHDCTGCNPIHLLVDSSSRDDLVRERPRSILKLLLDAGVDINAEIAQHMYKGYSALRLAVASELGSKAVALLLESGARADPGSLLAVFDEKFQYSGSYAGAYDYRAVDSANNLRVLDLLLRHRVDVNAADHCQRTALHLAALAVDEGHSRFSGPWATEDRALAPAVRKLVRAGADVNAVAASDRCSEHLGATPLHVAASRGAAHVASALLDGGADIEAKDADGRTPLDIAAARGQVGFLNVLLRRAVGEESPEMVALLIERGAEVDARDDVGWTPLHHALLGYYGDGDTIAEANVLLEHGVDVNAATATVGWTPLHLAAHLRGPGVLEIVQALIEQGADVNARTRIGGWSPARVARASDERRRNGPDAGASSTAVLAAIQAAGGKDEGCDDAPMLPVYVRGSPAYWEDQARWRESGAAAGCEYNLPFAVPHVLNAGGRSVPGSFTVPGVDEALLFAGFGIFEANSDIDYFDVASLQDRHGAILPIMAFDNRTDYKGLCLDRETNTHAAVFTRSYDGSCCPWDDTVYYHYDADAGNLVEAFVDGVVTQPTGVHAECRWRDTVSGLESYEDALSQLRVGDSASWPWWDEDLDTSSDPLWEGPLPTRVVPAEVVEAQLERLRGLPEVVRVWNADLNSPERQIVVAEYVGVPRSESVDVCEGVLLAWDEANREWRSIYDCAAFSDIEIHGDTLSAALYVGTVRCGLRRQSRLCYLEVDLTTWLAELWDEPYGNYWRNDRGRPDRNTP